MIKTEINAQSIQLTPSLLRTGRDVCSTITAVALRSLQIVRKNFEYCIHEVKKNFFNPIHLGSFLAFKLFDFVVVCVKSIESFLNKIGTESEVRYLTHGKLISLVKKLCPNSNNDDGICGKYAFTILEDLLEGSSAFITTLKKLDNLMRHLKEEDLIKEIKKDKDLSNFFDKLDRNSSKHKTDSLIGAISGTYTNNPQDLLPLMLSFQEQLSASSIPFKSLAFLIGTKHHGIVFEFSPEENVYRLIDVNDLNANIFPLASISGKIAQSYDFSSEQSKAFSMKVFLSTDKENKLDADCIFNAWKTSFLSKQAQSLSSLGEEEKISWLSSASDSNDEQSVTLLVGTGMNVNQTAGKKESTPLYLATQNGHEKVVEILVNNGSNVNLPNKRGVVPLHVASQNGLEKVVEILVNSGSNVNQPDEKGFTPLHSASQFGYEKIVQMFLNEGAKINQGNKDGSTPLGLASENGHEKVVEILISQGADVNQPDEKGFISLHWAAQNGHEKVAEILINNGSNVNQAGAGGVTPLYMACQKGHEKVVEILINNGSNVNQAVEGGYTPLYMACQKGHEKVVKMLLDKGADVNQSTGKRCAPLHVASQFGYEKIVQMLIDARADVNLTNIAGKSPLFIARYMGYRKIEQMLMSANSDPK